MVTVPVALDKNRRLRLGSDRRIYRTNQIDLTKYANGYRRRIPFVVSRTFFPASLTSAHVRFRAAHPALATVANGGFSQTGNDFLLTDVNGTPIPFMIESYGNSSGIIRGRMLHPALSKTTLNPGYLYFDNPDINTAPTSNIDLEFIASWDIPGRLDLKAGAMNFNSDFTTTGTIIGPSAGFDGTAGATRTCSASLLAGRTDLAFECVMRLTDSLAAYEVFSVGTTNDLTFRMFNVGGDNTGAQLRFNGATGVVEARYAAGTFEVTNKTHFIARFRSSGGLQLYKNGILQSPIFTSGNNVGGLTLTAANPTLTLGGANVPFKGTLDGVVLLSTMPSADMIFFRHVTAKFPAHVVAFGPDVETPGVIYDVVENVFLYTNNNTPQIINLADAVFSAVNRVPTITGFSAPSSGSLAQTSSTSLTYTPTAGFEGEVSTIDINVSTA